MLTSPAGANYPLAACDLVLFVLKIKSTRTKFRILRIVPFFFDFRFSTSSRILPRNTSKIIINGKMGVHFKAEDKFRFVKIPTEDKLYFKSLIF